MTLDDAYRKLSRMSGQTRKSLEFKMWKFYLEHEWSDKKYKLFKCDLFYSNYKQI